MSDWAEEMGGEPRFDLGCKGCIHSGGCVKQANAKKSGKRTDLCLAAQVQGNTKNS